MNKRINRNVWIAVIVSASLICNTCARVDGGPIERVFARKDLPHGPAFGFYRTVWHEWPGMHEQVYYEPELADEVPYESAPQEGPELFPPGETRGPDFDADDSAPAPPPQERPPGFEQPMAPEDDAVPAPPDTAPMGPTESPDRPAEQGPESPSNQPEIPPGFEEMEVKPEEDLPMPRSQGTSSSRAPKLDLPRQIFRDAQPKSSVALDRELPGAGIGADAHAPTASKTRRVLANGHTTTGMSPHDTALDIAADTRDEVEGAPAPNFATPIIQRSKLDDTASESEPLMTLNPLRANRITRPLAPARTAPVLRSVSSMKQAQYTSETSESDALKRQMTTDETTGRRSAFSATPAPGRSMYVNPLRARATKASSHSRFESNPLRTSDGR